MEEDQAKKPKLDLEQSMEEPDEVSTEVVIDSDGTKRIIVRKLRKTLVTSRQTTQQHISQLSEVGVDGSSVVKAFSEATMKGQQVTITRQRAGGGVEMASKQSYSGKVVTGSPEHEINVREYESTPEYSHRVIEGALEEISPRPLEIEKALQEGFDAKSNSSTVHASVQQVTRKIIRRTRRIIRKVRIVDGKEVCTEEIIEEPEEVEIDEQSIPHMSINIVKSDQVHKFKDHEIIELGKCEEGPVTVQNIPAKEFYVPIRMKSIDSVEDNSTKSQTTESQDGTNAFKWSIEVVKKKDLRSFGDDEKSTTEEKAFTKTTSEQLRKTKIKGEGFIEPEEKLKIGNVSTDQGIQSIVHQEMYDDQNNKFKIQNETVIKFQDDERIQLGASTILDKSNSQEHKLTKIQEISNDLSDKYVTKSQAVSDESKKLKINYNLATDLQESCRSKSNDFQDESNIHEEISTKFEKSTSDQITKSKFKSETGFVAQEIDNNKQGNSYKTELLKITDETLTKSHETFKREIESRARSEKFEMNEKILAMSQETGKIEDQDSHRLEKSRTKGEIDIPLDTTDHIEKLTIKKHLDVEFPESVESKKKPSYQPKKLETEEKAYAYYQETCNYSEPKPETSSIREEMFIKLQEPVNSSTKEKDQNEMLRTEDRKNPLNEFQENFKSKQGTNGHSEKSEVEANNGEANKNKKKDDYELKMSEIKKEMFALPFEKDNEVEKLEIQKNIDFESHKTGKKQKETSCQNEKSKVAEDILIKFQGAGNSEKKIGDGPDESNVSKETPQTTQEMFIHEFEKLGNKIGAIEELEETEKRKEKIYTQTERSEIDAGVSTRSQKTDDSNSKVFDQHKTTKNKKNTFSDLRETKKHFKESCLQSENSQALIETSAWDQKVTHHKHENSRIKEKTVLKFPDINDNKEGSGKEIHIELQKGSQSKNENSGQMEKFTMEQEMTSASQETADNAMKLKDYKKQLTTFEEFGKNEESISHQPKSYKIEREINDHSKKLEKEEKESIKSQEIRDESSELEADTKTFMKFPGTVDILKSLVPTNHQLEKSEVEENTCRKKDEFKPRSNVQTEKHIVAEETFVQGQEMMSDNQKVSKIEKERMIEFQETGKNEIGTSDKLEVSKMRNPIIILSQNTSKCQQETHDDDKQSEVEGEIGKNETERIDQTDNLKIDTRSREQNKSEKRSHNASIKYESGEQTLTNFYDNGSQSEKPQIWKEGVINFQTIDGNDHRSLQIEKDAFVKSRETGNHRIGEQNSTQKLKKQKTVEDRHLNQEKIEISEDFHITSLQKNNFEEQFHENTGVPIRETTSSFLASEKFAQSDSIREQCMEIQKGENDSLKLYEFIDKSECGDADKIFTVGSQNNESLDDDTCDSNSSLHEELALSRDDKKIATSELFSSASNPSERMIRATSGILDQEVTKSIDQVEDIDIDSLSSIENSELYDDEKSSQVKHDLSEEKVLYEFSVPKPPKPRGSVEEGEKYSASKTSLSKDTSNLNKKPMPQNEEDDSELFSPPSGNSAKLDISTTGILDQEVTKSIDMVDDIDIDSLSSIETSESCEEGESKEKLKTEKADKSSTSQVCAGSSEKISNDSLRKGKVKTQRSVDVTAFQNLAEACIEIELENKTDTVDLQTSLRSINKDDSNFSPSEKSSTCLIKEIDELKMQVLGTDTLAENINDQNTANSSTMSNVQNFLVNFDNISAMQESTGSDSTGRKYDVLQALFEDVIQYAAGKTAAQRNATECSEVERSFCSLPESDKICAEQIHYASEPAPDKGVIKIATDSHENESSDITIQKSPPEPMHIVKNEKKSDSSSSKSASHLEVQMHEIDRRPNHMITRDQEVTDDTTNNIATDTSGSDGKINLSVSKSDEKMGKMIVTSETSNIYNNMGEPFDNSTLQEEKVLVNLKNASFKSSETTSDCHQTAFDLRFYDTENMKSQNMEELKNANSSSSVDIAATGNTFIDFNNLITEKGHPKNEKDLKSYAGNDHSKNLTAISIDQTDTDVFNGIFEGMTLDLSPQKQENNNLKDHEKLRNCRFGQLYGTDNQSLVMEGMSNENYLHASSINVNQEYCKSGKITQNKDASLATSSDSSDQYNENSGPKHGDNLGKQNSVEGVCRSDEVLVLDEPSVVSQPTQNLEKVQFAQSRGNTIQTLFDIQHEKMHNVEENDDPDSCIKVQQVHESDELYKVKDQSLISRGANKFLHNDNIAAIHEYCALTKSPENLSLLAQTPNIISEILLDPTVQHVENQGYMKHDKNNTVSQSYVSTDNLSLESAMLLDQGNNNAIIERSKSVVSMNNSLKCDSLESLGEGVSTTTATFEIQDQGVDRSEVNENNYKGHVIIPTGKFAEDEINVKYSGVQSFPDCSELPETNKEKIIHSSRFANDESISQAAQGNDISYQIFSGQKMILPSADCLIQSKIILQSSDIPLSKDMDKLKKIQDVPSQQEKIQNTLLASQGMNLGLEDSLIKSDEPVEELGKTCENIDVNMPNLANSEISGISTESDFSNKRITSCKINLSDLSINLSKDFTRSKKVLEHFDLSQQQILESKSAPGVKRGLKHDSIVEGEESVEKIRGVNEKVANLENLNTGIHLASKRTIKSNESSIPFSSQLENVSLETLTTSSIHEVVDQGLKIGSILEDNKSLQKIKKIDRGVIFSSGKDSANEKILHTTIKQVNLDDSCSYDTSNKSHTGSERNFGSNNLDILYKSLPDLTTHVQQQYDSANLPKLHDGQLFQEVGDDILGNELLKLLDEKVDQERALKDSASSERSNTNLGHENMDNLLVSGEVTRYDSGISLQDSSFASYNYSEQLSQGKELLRTSPLERRYDSNDSLMFESTEAVPNKSYDAHCKDLLLREEPGLTNEENKMVGTPELQEKNLKHQEKLEEWNKIVTDIENNIESSMVANLIENDNAMQDNSVYKDGMDNVNIDSENISHSIQYDGKQNLKHEGTIQIKLMNQEVNENQEGSITHALEDSSHTIDEKTTEIADYKNIHLVSQIVAKSDAIYPVVITEKDCLKLRKENDAWQITTEEECKFLQNKEDELVPMSVKSLVPLDEQELKIIQIPEIFEEEKVFEISERHTSEIKDVCAAAKASVDLENIKMLDLSEEHEDNNSFEYSKSNESMISVDDEPRVLKIAPSEEHFDISGTGEYKSRKEVRDVETSQEKIKCNEITTNFHESVSKIENFGFESNLKEVPFDSESKHSVGDDSDKVSAHSMVDMQNLTELNMSDSNNVMINFENLASIQLENNIEHFSPLDEIKVVHELFPVEQRQDISRNKETSVQPILTLETEEAEFQSNVKILIEKSEVCGANDIVNATSACQNKNQSLKENQPNLIIDESKTRSTSKVTSETVSNMSDLKCLSAKSISMKIKELEEAGLIEHILFGTKFDLTKDLFPGTSANEALFDGTLNMSNLREALTILKDFNFDNFSADGNIRRPLVSNLEEFANHLILPPVDEEQVNGSLAEVNTYIKY